ncbi:MAG: mannose-1-phosphate guanylyltransferase/mannose-6-phosphate isomerase [Candidatus Muproteobacteria bacterium RBG_16_60_9]|uniref:mannose-1-phosphate guanylyltransferase n=1 Tax=Candidatus Muproteobacteria bacterium RBG_16_60_9 TaxID=1817755 RepID=A0A1F6V5X9_9PROT|nr:MAG: mannose-1-phosphate guanylyltransferase/mannose-6-phosphate isomerase [Candidatus Muproteobacteria bacterium RBG_16_60_9]
MTPIHPVILSGGSGTRLWPLSREHFPKQLLQLVGDGSLLQQTITRLDGLSAVAEPIVVCNEEHRFLIGEQLLRINRKPAAIILEPAGRNTCPAVTLAALALTRGADDSIMLVMPADHVIKDNAAFQAAITSGLKLAQRDRLVTFGIVPTTPATGYGYIRKGAGNAVVEFVEKPDAATAQRYLDSGDFLWNSGMFLMRASVWLEELRQHAPQILAQCEAAFSRGRQDGEFYRVDVDAFRQCKSDSIDYAVMEKTARSAVVPLAAGWSDIGAWSTLWEVSPRDANGNVVQGDTYLQDVNNTFALSQHRLVACVGVSDLVVIETSDAVLVAHKDRAQDVKRIVDHLKARNRSEYLTHRRVHRPWGSYEGVDAGDRFQVKRLTVKPGASLSLQMHHHRAEHWVVVKGTARVTRGDEVVMLTENQSTFIPIGTRHRLENPGTIPLEIIEVQSGSYLGEDDIVRYDDKYDRVKS